MDGLIIIGAIAGFVLFFGLVIFLAIRMEKKRTAAFELAAQQMGLEFHPEGTADLISRHLHFPSFNKGRDQRAKNHMAGELQGIRIDLFDFRYTTGSGRNRTAWNQTVLSIASHHIDLPDFTISPEGLFAKIGSVFGYQDIDFDTHPEFSRHFLLRGPDEAAIRLLFSPPVLEWFQNHLGVTADANGDMFVFFRASRRAKPEQIPDLLKEGLSLFKELARQ